MQTVIIGGTLDGIELALAARAAGHSAVLLTATTYVGDDCTRTWAAYGTDRQHDVLHRLDRLGYSAWLSRQKQAPEQADQSAHTLLLPGRTKRFLLSRLLDTGVQVCFLTFFAGVRIEDRRITGVLLAGKHGIRLVEADLVFDATLYRSASWSLAGRELQLPQGHPLAYTLEYFGHTGVAATYPQWGVTCHPGGVRPDQVYLTLRRPCPRPLNLNEAQRYVRGEALQVAKALHSQIPAFYTAYLAGALPDAIDLPPLEPPPSPCAGWIPAWPLASAIDRITDCTEQSARTPAPSGTQPASLERGYLLYGQMLPDHAVRLEPVDDPRSTLILAQVVLPLAQLDLPTTEQDVLIVGGGTAGLCAAAAAAQAGLRAGLIELAGNLGGTRTAGGVWAFYHGNRNQLFQSILAEIQAVSDQINADVQGRQTIAAETFYYEQFLAGRQAFVQTSGVACALAADGGKIQTVLQVNESGLCRHRARIFLDATGDADLAVLAGVPADFGDADLACSQDYSQWHRSSRTAYDGSLAANIDQGVLDIRYFSEWNRAIIANTWRSPDYDWVDMLTVRESRRIQGRYRISLRDVFRRTSYTDVICSATSDYDPHSHCYHLVGRLGLMPQHAPTQWVDIPYRSLLPDATDNLMVIAKAISIDQDAFNYIRMNADVMTLGAVAGRIAAESLRQRRPLADLDLADLQSELRRQAVIHDRSTAIQAEISPKQLVERLAAGDESAFADAVLTDWPDLPDLLLVRLSGISAAADELVLRILLWYGRIERLEASLARLDQLIRSSQGSHYPDRNPDHNQNMKGGILGKTDDYWRLNQLVILLARAQVKAVLPRLAELIEQTESGGPPVNHATAYLTGRIDNQCIPHYDRVLNLAEAARMLPDASLCRPLERLLGKTDLSGYCRTAVTDEAVNFHMGLLELKLAMAAAACGSHLGRERVASYSRDIHLTLARAADRFLADQPLLLSSAAVLDPLIAVSL